jgi:hypothetical protein
MRAMAAAISSICAAADGDAQRIGRPWLGSQRVI